MIVRRTRARVALLVLLAFVLWTPGAYAACPGNIALNVGFEDGASQRGAGEVTVANGWEPFWQPRSAGDGEGINFRPEYKMEDASRYGTRRVREGNWSQKFFGTYATHQAGIYQRVNVQDGSSVALSAWAQAWSSKKDDPAYSSGGQYFLSVGIDPTGGTDFNSSNIVWSDKNGTLDQWVELKVQAQAKGGTVTLYLRGEASWPVKHNDAHFDDVCVTAQAPAPRATAVPKPTAVPEPTDTPEPEPTDVPEDTPTPEASSTPEPSPTAVSSTIRAFVFEDRDGNGLRGDTEPLLAGAKIELMGVDRQILSSHTTDGVSEPYTFANLPAGQYIVNEQDPAGYESTSSNQWAVALAVGAEIEVFFADRFAPAPTATRFLPTPTIAPPTQVPAPPATIEPQQAPRPPIGQSLYRVSGITVALLALLLPILLRYLRGES